MDNVYDKWNKVKKKTEKIQRKLGIKPRDIFWFKVGKNIGHEVYGKGEEFVRPVIVVRQLTSDLFVGIPTTSTKKIMTIFITYRMSIVKRLVSIVWLCCYSLRPTVKNDYSLK